MQKFISTLQTLGLLQGRLSSRQEVQGLSQSLNLNSPVSLEISEFQ